MGESTPTNRSLRLQMARVECYVGKNYGHRSNLAKLAGMSECNLRRVGTDAKWNPGFRTFERLVCALDSFEDRMLIGAIQPAAAVAQHLGGISTLALAADVDWPTAWQWMEPGGTQNGSVPARLVSTIIRWADDNHITLPDTLFYEGLGRPLRATNAPDARTVKYDGKAVAAA